MDYREYDTPSHIAEIWADETKVGKCDKCGMDDLPVWENRLSEKKCIWCLERSALWTHLMAYGSRHQKRQMSSLEKFWQALVDTVTLKGIRNLPDPAVPLIVIGMALVVLCFAIGALAL